MPRHAQRRRLASSAALLWLVAAGCAARRETPPPPPPVASPAPTPTATPTPAPAAPEPARTSAAQAGTQRRNVVLVGDSTTYGTPEPQPGVRRAIQSPYNPGATLQVLLDDLEPLPADGGTPWRGARVHNLAVGASTTSLWLETPPPGCGSVLELFPIVKAACAKKVAWIAAVPSAVGDAHVDAVIVDLGINDLLVTKDPAETVARLERIRKILAPAPVLFFPPIAPPGSPRGDWPQRVRAAMVKRGLFTEEQYPPYVPTYDGLHPTHGGYAAMGGLWIDRLRKLP